MLHSLNTWCLTNRKEISSKWEKTFQELISVRCFFIGISSYILFMLMCKTSLTGWWKHSVRSVRAQVIFSVLLGTFYCWKNTVVMLLQIWYCHHRERNGESSVGSIINWWTKLFSTQLNVLCIDINMLFVNSFSYVLF